MATRARAFRLNDREAALLGHLHAELADEPAVESDADIIRWGLAALDARLRGDAEGPLRDARGRILDIRGMSVCEARARLAEHLAVA